MPPPNKHCDPDELIRLLNAGDIDALDSITRCFGDRLMTEAQRRCRTQEEAEDAIQEMALTAWRYGPGFRGEGQVERWLVRLVATACSRLRRGMKRDTSLHVPDAELLAEEDSPEMLVARGQLAQALAGALQALPPRDRAILLLADGQGLTGPEIAAALSMTPGAVRSRLSRAHARLREALARDGISASALSELR